VKILTVCAAILIAGTLLLLLHQPGLTLMGFNGGIFADHEYIMPTMVPTLSHSLLQWHNEPESLDLPGTAPFQYLGVDVGFHYSPSDMNSMPGPSYWVNVGSKASEKFSGSKAGAIWVVGLAQAEGSCYLTFPSSGQQYSNVFFAPSDRNEQYLDSFDSKGMKVFLQIEPGQADVNTLIRLVLDRYGHHPCVAGIGIDAEWLQFKHYPSGRQVTDEEAAEWYRLVSSYNAGYTLALTHWQTGNMPPTYRTGLYFLYDGHGFHSLDDMVSKCASWGKSFPDNPVGFYIGFLSDDGWWRDYDDPYYKIGSKLLERIDNAKGLYWVSFSIKDIYPF
jgi:hypothetical protein